MEQTTKNADHEQILMQLELIDSKDEKKKKKTRKDEQTWDDHCTKDFSTPTLLDKQLGSLATNMGGNIYI